MPLLRNRYVLVLASVLAALPCSARAQDAPVLRGQVLVGEAVLDSGTVVLHQVTSVDQGQLDSVPVGPEGGFSFRLPEPPSRAQDRFYFASIRHQGILYFGSAVAEPAQLDSLYTVQAYDTLMVGPEGADIPIERRNIFFEPNGEEWRVTDIFELVNVEDRTLVAPEGGRVWSYPLLPGARDFTSGQGELSLDGTSFENDTVSIRAAIAPGQRVFIFRYTVDEPYGRVPTPGLTGGFSLLVREPAPRVTTEGLEFRERIEIEEGATYRRYAAVNVGPDANIRVVEAQVEGDLPMEWITVLMALALAAASLLVLRGRDGARPVAVQAPASRQALLMEIARLDEEFDQRANPSREERAAYEARRAELLARLQTGS